MMQDFDIEEELADRRKLHRRRATKSFKQWKRRTLVAFIGLTLTNAAAMAWIYDTRGDAAREVQKRQQAVNAQQKDIAKILVQVQQGRKTTLLKICSIDNRQNAAVRRILNRFDIDSSAFAPISCKSLVSSAKTEHRPRANKSP